MGESIRADGFLRLPGEPGGSPGLLLNDLTQVAMPGSFAALQQVVMELVGFHFGAMVEFGMAEVCFCGFNSREKMRE